MVTVFFFNKTYYRVKTGDAAGSVGTGEDPYCQQQ